MTVTDAKMPIEDGEAKRATLRQGLAAGGGVLGALAASSCCVVPLALFSLGISGVWIGNLAALTPYQPIFVLIAAGFLAYGFYLVYWKPRIACTSEAACARPLPTRIVKGSLWVATVLLAVSVAFPYVAPAILGI
jgi:mercuric ion transport protein